MFIWSMVFLGHTQTDIVNTAQAVGKNMRCLLKTRHRQRKKIVKYYKLIRVQICKNARFFTYLRSLKQIGWEKKVIYDIPGY